VFWLAKIAGFVREVGFVLESCPRTCVALLLTEIVSPAILLIGICSVNAIDFAPPFEGFTEPLRRGFMLIFIGVAVYAFCRLATETQQLYRDARMRLFG
jgi:hypothetical protein